MKSKPENLPQFHPQTEIRDWGGGESFKIRDAQTGVCVFGATGSGKSSSIARHLAFGYLAAGFGGLVLCAKPEERRQWEQWTAETGRTKDVVIFDTSGRWRYNFLDAEATRPGEGGGLAINIVNLLDEISQAVSGHADDTGGEGKFWQDALHLLLTYIVYLLLFADLPLTMSALRAVVSSAPYTPAQAADSKWRETSQCALILAEAEKATRESDSEVRSDFQECWNYWMIEFPNLSEKTRSIITLMFSMVAQPLTARPLGKLFSSHTNIRPEDCFDGKIIIVDIPIQTYRLVGRIANLLWKYCFQVAVLRRAQPTEKDTYLRPVFLYADEAQYYLTNFDSTYQAVARSAGGCTVYLTQSRESYLKVLRKPEAVDALLGNLQAKFFCQGVGDTNTWASKLLGERWVTSTSTNVGQQQGKQELTNPQTNNSNSTGVSQTQQLRHYLEASAFTTLKRGGEMYNYQVEVIVYNGGHLFASPGKEPFLPYKLLTFNQR